MTHPLVTQLRFTRQELIRAIEGVSSEDAQKRLGPMNCISWILGHLANQEHNHWVRVAQNKMVAEGLHSLVGYGQPASTPELDEMRTVWETVTTTADEYLDTLTTDLLQTHKEWNGEQLEESIGTMLYRNIYHYWFHIGEAHAIRQQLGHSDLPEFVGDMTNAAYRPEG